MSLTRYEVYQIMSEAGMPVSLIGLADRDYETVSDGWVNANYAAWLKSRPDALVQFAQIVPGVRRLVPRWIEQAGDCDNLALGLLVHADTGNALAAATLGTPRGGLAFGVVFYIADTSTMQGGHAINWYITHERALRFFEPGTGFQLELSSNERASASFILAA